MDLTTYNLVLIPILVVPAPKQNDLGLLKEPEIISYSRWFDTDFNIADVLRWNQHKAGQHRRSQEHPILQPPVPAPSTKND